jgi:hypothetical protein
MSIDAAEREAERRYPAGFGRPGHSGDPRAAFIAGASWQREQSALSESERNDWPSDGSCIRCGAVPRNASSGLCATCVDEDAFELLPCPFCGGQMMRREALWPSDGDTDGIIHACPTDCPLPEFNVGIADQCASVAAAWNHRATWQREQSALPHPAPDSVSVSRETLERAWVALCTPPPKSTPSSLLPRSSPMSKAAQDVLAERKRQVEVEGWTPEHDDAHSKSELAHAAACYALKWKGNYPAHASWWPWAEEWWKPKDRRRDLVRAGSLIIAEIERLDRLSPPTEKE